MPLQMFVFPVRDGTPLPPVFAKFAEVAPNAALAPAPSRSAATATSGSSSGPPPCCGERVARRAPDASGASLLALGPARVPRGLLRLPGGDDRRPRARADGTLDLDPLARGRRPTRRCATSSGSPSGRPRCRRCSRWLVALPGAYVLARATSSPGERVVRALVTVPFVLPTVVVGTAFAALLGAGGPLAGLGLDQTVWAILVAHVFFNYAVVVRTVGGLWAHLDPRQEEAARMLGASRWRAFRAVTLPALRPAIAAAAAIVFLFTFTSFGVILILGGPRFATLETEIYRQTAQLLTCRSPPRSRSCSSSPSWLLLAGHGRVSQGARARRAAAAGRRARPRAAPRTARRARRRRREPRGDGPAARRPDRSCSSSGRSHTPSGYGLRLLPRARRAAPRRARSSCRRSTRSRNVAAVRGRSPPCSRSWSAAAAAIALARRQAGRGLDALVLAAARRLGGHRRLRLPHRARRAAARPAHVVAAWSRSRRRSIAIPFVVRIDDAGAARHRPAPARGGRRCSARRRARSGARSTCRSSPAPRSWPPASRSRSRSASSARPSSSSGRLTRRCRSLIFRLLGQPGAAELRRGDGGERDPDGPDRGWRSSASSASASRSVGEF